MYKYVAHADMGNRDATHDLRTRAEMLGNLLYNFYQAGESSLPDLKRYRKAVNKLSDYLRQNRSVLTSAGLGQVAEHSADVDRLSKTGR